MLFRSRSWLEARSPGESQAGQFSHRPAYSSDSSLNLRASCQRGQSPREPGSGSASGLVRGTQIHGDIHTRFQPHRSLVPQRCQLCVVESSLATVPWFRTTQVLHTTLGRHDIVSVDLTSEPSLNTCFEKCFTSIQKCFECSQEYRQDMMNSQRQYLHMLFNENLDHSRRPEFIHPSWNHSHCVLICVQAVMLWIPWRMLFLSLSVIHILRGVFIIYFASAGGGYNLVGSCIIYLTYRNHDDKVLVLMN